MAFLDPVLCDFNDAVSASKCFRCLQPNQLLAMQAYILWQNWLVQGQDVPADLNALLEASRYFTRLTDKQLLAMIALMMCELGGWLQAEEPET